MYSVHIDIIILMYEPRQIFRIGTVRYAEGLWRMRRHGPVIAHCTDSEDLPEPNSRNYASTAINHCHGLVQFCPVPKHLPDSLALVPKCLMDISALLQH